MEWDIRGIKPVCRVYKSDEKINIKPLFNRNMNLIKKYKVNIYEKNVDDKWALQMRVDGDINHLLIDKKLYFLSGLDVLIPLNMDFNNSNCERCYQIFKLNKATIERINNRQGDLFREAV